MLRLLPIPYILVYRGLVYKAADILSRFGRYYGGCSRYLQGPSIAPCSLHPALCMPVPKITLAKVCYPRLYSYPSPIYPISHGLIGVHSLPIPRLESLALLGRTYNIHSCSLLPPLGQEVYVHLGGHRHASHQKFLCFCIMYTIVLGITFHWSTEYTCISCTPCLFRPDGQRRRETYRLCCWFLAFSLLYAYTLL